MTKTLRLIELFAGYGSQALAIKRLGIPYEHYRVVEFDKYAIKSYNAVHGTNFTTTDIRDVKGSDLGIVDTDKYNYLLTYSFPCTDLSLAGKREGMSRDSGTRSGLLWEVERILRELKDSGSDLPQYLVMENVPQVHSEQNIKDFGEWISFLDSLGYISKWQDLNAKDYGVAQNRERCFMVSYLDKSLKFAFPCPVPLTKTARDYLEDTVDNKYYLKTEKAEELINKLILESEDELIRIKANVDKGYTELESGGVCDMSYPDSESRRGRAQSLPRLCPTITSSGELNKIDRQVVDRSTTCPRVKDTSNCIRAAQRGIDVRDSKETGVIEKIVVEERTDEGLRTFCGNVPESTLRTTESCGDKRVLEISEAASRLAYLNYKRIEDVDKDIAKTLCARDYKGFGSGFDTMNGVIEHQGYLYRIRKLTPLECFRLMDVSDEDSEKMLAVNSETQCYKQAGNSIVVAVLEAIFKNIFCGGSETVRAQIDIFDIL